MVTCPLNRRLDTMPNLVTLARPVCTLPFVLLCAQAQHAATVWPCGGALMLFILISSSDVLDGWLARRLGQETPLGRTLDHVCDVLFILTALGFFVSRGLVPWWLPAAIAWSFALYVVDSWWRTARRPQRTLLASRVGHLGGILYYVTVGVVTSHLCTDNRLLPAVILYGWCLGLALLALLSGAERFVLLARAFRHRAPARQGAENIRRSARLES